uniref:CDP-diacylglycerol--inositol 3-phosphatidyltransferase n=1 Tax=Eptatretus burgeri TaxID=7764 RepID=A0A8C4PZS3_EPTBU
PEFAIIIHFVCFPGYVRLVCLLLAWFSFKSLIAFVLFYSIFAILDAVDGAVARRLSQTSAFGAFFDIFLDNLGPVVDHVTFVLHWGDFVSVLESTTFVCTHGAFLHNWKHEHCDAPYWVCASLGAGFRRPPGMLAIAGLHLLPLWLYGLESGHLFSTGFPYFTLWLVCAVLSGGGLLCAAVEVILRSIHIMHLASMVRRDETLNIDFLPKCTFSKQC